MICGYARTSTADQLAGLAAQERDLLAAGAERTYSEHASAMKKREQLDACLAFLKPGDVLMVTKPDRLARSTGHLLSIVEDLNKRGVGLILLSMGGERLDTRNATSKLMLVMLGAIAEFERSLMAERQREGILKAQAEGKFKDRPIDIDRDKVMVLVRQVGPTIAAQEMGIARSSVNRIMDEFGYRARRPKVTADVGEAA